MARKSDPIEFIRNYFNAISATEARILIRVIAADCGLKVSEPKERKKPPKKAATVQAGA